MALHNVWTRVTQNPATRWHLLHEDKEVEEAVKIEKVGNVNSERYGIHMEYRALPKGQYPWTKELAEANGAKA